MNQIHPTALVHPKAELGKNNYIGPYCYVDECVHMGDNNRLEAYVSIGTPPEHKSLHLNPNNDGVIIGSDCVFKEFVTINRGTKTPTWIGDGVWMLTKSHVGHDAQLEHGVNLACAVFIGGHSVIMQGANLGLSAVVHQNRIVGSYCMIGMNATVTKNIFPFVKAFGSPADIKGLNEIGLLRSGVKAEDLVKFHQYVAELIGGDSQLVEIQHPYSHHLTRFGAHIEKGKHG